MSGDPLCARVLLAVTGDTPMQGRDSTRFCEPFLRITAGLGLILLMTACTHSILEASPAGGVIKLPMTTEVDEVAQKIADEQCEHFGRKANVVYIDGFNRTVSYECVVADALW